VDPPLNWKAGIYISEDKKRVPLKSEFNSDILRIKN